MTYKNACSLLIATRILCYLRLPRRPVCDVEVRR